MSEWTPIGSVASFEIDIPAPVGDGDDALCVVRIGSDDFRVFADRCTHARCTLSDGIVEDGKIECPCHGARFDLGDGTAVDGPATDALLLLETCTEAGDLLVDREPSS